jgi:hypothetical protein
VIDIEWRQAFATRGLIARKVRARLDAAPDGRVELGSPGSQPFKRNFAILVNRVASNKFGAGNYRLESMKDPPRIAVWEGSSVSGVPVGKSMSRHTSALLLAYMERRL